MKFIKPTVVFAALIFIAACNHQNEKSPVVQELALQDVNTENKSINGEADRTKETGSDGNNPGLFNADPQDKQQIPPQKKDDDKQKKQPATEKATNPEWDKKIIKTASVNLEVKDHNSYYSSLREKIKNMGGYIAQEEQSQSDYKIENAMSIKVPVDQFDNAVVQLTANVEKVNEKKIASQDVTAEVVDTKSRMEAKKQVRQRYMDLLGQAKNMQEILSVQSEINGIQEQIESATGRLGYLTHSSVFSTINLTYYQVINSSAKDTDKPSFGKKLIAGFKAGWEITSELFIGLVTIWPLLLSIFLGVFAYKKIRVQKTKQA